VAAEVLIHIGRHLGSSYSLAQVAPDLLVSLNRLAAAKVPGWLDKYAAEKKATQVN